MIFLFSVLLPSLAFANCEAGGYSIHTVAKYAAQDSLEASVMLFRMEKSLVKAATGSLMQETTMKTLKGVPFTVNLGAEKCVVNEGWKTDPAYNPESPEPDLNPFWLDLSSCPKLVKAIDGGGYLFLNSALKTVKLGKKLEVKEAKADAYAELKKAASHDAHKRKRKQDTAGDQNNE